MSAISSLFFILRDYAHNLGKAPLVFVMTFVVPFLMYMASPAEDRAQEQPPQATPCLPLLGNALHYKKNPDIYLSKQAQTLGGIFSINLAGLQTTILSSKDGMKQLANASERVLSAHAALSDFGFRYTLGDRNIFAGSDLHKKIIKQQYSKPIDLEESAQLYWKYLIDSIQKEIACPLGEVIQVRDFFVTVRRIILRTITYEMLGSSVVEMYNSLDKNADFISEFMEFQDLVEDCTAKAAVCPAWLAAQLFLKDCEKKRMQLVAKLSDAMKRALNEKENGDDAVVGKWLRSAYSMQKNNEETRLYQLDEIADFGVGLLFAAHKNPSIASSQAILFSLEFDQQSNTCKHSGELSFMERVYSEASIVKQTVSATLLNKNESVKIDNKVASNNLIDALNTCEVIDRIVVETLRVTAHSIGAVRKVVCEGGWKVSVEDERSPGRPVKHYTLPFGTYVGVSHIIPHRDHHRWGKECAKFNPLRENLVERSTNDFEYTTFSHGVHKCPGRPVAMLIMRLFVVALLSHFEVSVPDNEILPATSFERATLAQRSAPCALKCKRIRLYE